MASTLVRPYTTLANAKARIAIATADTADDTIIEAVINAVSRAIDGYCGRRFYAVAETRYYTPARSDALLVDDLVSVTSLATDQDGDLVYETAWAAGDYVLYPYNAALESVPGP